MKSIFITLTLVLFTVIGQAQTNPPAKLTANKCQGITKAGNPCKSTIIMKDGYCRVHSPNTPRCGAKTTAGQPCKMPVDTVGVKCRFHKP